jgi:predicted molibdopterin-dependent oxidoreductase YjgC
MHRGMSYERLEALGGMQWPVPSEDHPGSPFLHGRLWEMPRGGPPAPFSATPWAPPVDQLDAEFPIRLTTGRRLDSYNTGVQSERFSSPLRRGETIDLHPEDAARLGVEPGEVVQVSSRRGSIEAPVRLDPNLRPGLAFMTFHFPDQIDVNVLTIDAVDPKSGTAEFKATAVRVEKLNGSALQTAGVASREAGK